MRWLFGRGAQACDACGAELERGAVWCGACGARADGDPDQAVVPETATVPADGSADQLPLARRALVAVVVLALVALAVAWQLRSPVPEPLLGHLGHSTGMSATGPPPSGLRMAWSHESPHSMEGWAGGWPLEVVARDDRIRVRNLVVETQRGRLVGVTPDLWQVTGTERTIIDGQELLVVDTLSGEIRSRAPLSEDLQGVPLGGVHRGQGASLVGLDRDSMLVADDGSVVAEVEGGFLDFVDRAWQDPVAFPVRGQVTEDELSTPLWLVSASTGEVVSAFPESRTRAADVSGDLAMVASTDAAIDLYRAPLDADEVEWTVALLDARTGEQRVQLTATSSEPPRLVGTFADGTAVLTTRSGDEYPLLAVTEDGQVSTIAHLPQRSRPDDTGLIVDSTALPVATMAGDLLVAAMGDDTVVGLDRTGSRLWELEAPGTAGLRGGGSHLVTDGDDHLLRLVRAADGEVVATVAPPEEPWIVAETVGLPFGAIGGHVGISRPGRYLTGHQGPLAETTWLDLRTGETATPEDVFAPFVGDEEPAPDWVFHGVVTDELGEPEPVFSRTQPEGRFELLDPGEGFQSFRLSPSPTGGAPALPVASAGASTDRFAVWHEGVHNPADMATIVLDRTTGATTTTVDGVRGVMLLGDLLLAEVISESFTMTAVVAVDPTTGEERWRAAPHAHHPGHELLLADDELVVDAGAARVTVRATQEGTQLWSHATDVELSGDVLLGPDRVVVATTHGELVALDRGDGTVAWRTALETPVASLTGAGDHVLVGTHDGLVIHLDDRGREVQRIAVGTGGVHDVAALGETVVAVVDRRIVGLRADGNGITRGDEVDLP